MSFAVTVCSGGLGKRKFSGGCACLAEIFLKVDKVLKSKPTLQMVKSS